jgi:hypothetical protein
MFGRDDELRAAVDALREGRHVQLAGAPGGGKTSLLRLLVNEPTVQPPEGVVYVQADGLLLSGVMRILFDALYVTDARRVPTEAEIRALLHDEELLVVLDEPSLQEAEIRTLMAAMPRGHFLLARRTPYALDDEALTIELDPLEPDAALALFEEQLGRVLTLDERPAAEALIDKAGGHPLSIMLRAAEVRTGRQVL